MPGGDVCIKGFVESSFLDWPGRVAAVAFLPGCNFRCPFCHNRRLVLTPEKLEEFPLDGLLSSLASHEGWVDGLVVSGGEPTISPGLEGFLATVRGRSLAVKLDTNGSMPEVLIHLVKAGLLEAVAMDIKAPLTREAYSRAAGVPVDVCNILKSIDFLVECGIEAAFRATVVPGLHDEKAVREMAGALHGRRLLLQDFRPDDALDPAFREIRPFGPDRLKDLQCAADEAADRCQTGG